ncbi:MAG TPA: hypothetical protein VIX89_01585 [Bryobacteraceae bacterium]
MALFTDGPINRMIDLQNYENAILDVASTESIDLAGKIALAQIEIGTALTLFLLRRFPQRDFQSTIRRTIGVSDVAVTDQLRQWHAHKALALVYRDAYDNQLNDRYLGKWTQYEQLTKRSLQEYLQIGVGLVADPIPKAAVPALNTLPGTASSGTFYIAVTWVNQQRQEGSPSDVAQISTLDGQHPVVTVENPPARAIGWNAYVGGSPDTLRLQNGAPLAAAANWTVMGELAQGSRPGDGQQPTWFLADQRLIERG